MKFLAEFAENGSIYDYIHKEYKRSSLPQRLLWAKEVVEGTYYSGGCQIIAVDSEWLVTCSLRMQYVRVGLQQW